MDEVFAASKTTPEIRLDSINRQFSIQGNAIGSLTALEEAYSVLESYAHKLPSKSDNPHKRPVQAHLYIDLTDLRSDSAIIIKKIASTLANHYDLRVQFQSPGTGYETHSLEEQLEAIPDLKLE